MKACRLIGEPHPASALRNQNSTRIFRKARVIQGTLLAAVMFAAPIRSDAASVLDSFNDVSGPGAVEGAPLTTFSTVGLAGGIGFLGGYDTANSQVDVLRTNDLTISLTNYVSGQTNSVNHWSVAATIDSVGIARRAKYRDTTPLTGTIWFSFLASLQNANGDIGLTINGAFSASGRFGTVPGMRVGLGNPSLPGALGVGTVASQADLTSITDGVNGAITTNNFVPTDGTAGLVLGKISTDAGSGFPKVEIWYNPDVPNEAALPAPVLSFIDTNSTFVPTTISRIGYQVVRSANGVQNEVIDNVKLSDEPNAFDIVYKNAPLPLPVLDVAVVEPGSESGPTNLQFTITSDRAVPSDLTVTYKLSGIGTNGFDGSGFVDADFTDPNFDTGAQISSVTIPSGQSNVTVTLSVIDDAVPEGDEPVILTLDPSSEYISGSSSATGIILENNDANVSAQYMFTRTTAAQIFDTNLTASAFSAAGVAGGFSTTVGFFISPDASIRARGDVTAGNAVDALANGNYMSFSVSPVFGRGLAITNIEFQAMYGNYLFQEPNAAEAVIFVRSSLDNFSSDLGSWTLQPDTVVFPAWYDLNLELGDAFTNVIGGVEFRLYIYDDSTQNQVGVRVDNLYVRAGTFPAVGVQQVGISTTVTNAAEPGTSGEFTISRAGDTSSPLTVKYSISGTASNGVDYVLLPGSVTIPAGQSNAVVTVSPLDDELIEPTETVQASLLSDPAYGIVGEFSASVDLADDGDIGGLAGYLFNESNNGAATLSAVAAGSTFQPDKIEVFNASSGPGNGNFGQNLAAGVGHGYATSASHSPPSTVFIRGEFIAKNAVDSVSQGNYLSFVLAPKPGYALTLTNLTAYFKMIGTPEETTWAFVRSSQDDFAADIGSPVAINGTATADPFQFWSLPLNAGNLSGPVEFRIYFYNNTDTIIRLDDVSFQGFATPGAAPLSIGSITVANGNVTINFTGAPTDDASSFKLQSAATVDGVFADDTSALITGSGGSFQATTAVNGAARFYKIRQ